MENKESLDLLNNWGKNEETFVGFKTDSVSAEEATISEVVEEVPYTPSESVADDLKNYSQTRQKVANDGLLEHVFTNELAAFYQENKRMMNHAERNRALHAIEKMIQKKQIYINEIGQVVVRKGSNVTPPKQKKKKRK